MTELAVVGSPFLDLFFEGLDALPRAGEEKVARRLHIGPGGSGMQAIGAARLGIATTLVAPLPATVPARLLRSLLTAEGVEVVPPEQAAASVEDAGVPVTALLGAPEGVAMATGLGGQEPASGDVARTGARAVVASLGRHHLVPEAVALYAVTGTLELGETGKGIHGRMRTARALILNRAEALALTGCAEAGDAARRLSENVPTAIVTLGAEGAIASRRDHGSIHIAAPSVDAIDATGAGDLFVAAYAWADLRGSSLADTLAWACLYAGLSVRAPTALAGAVTLSELLDEGLARDLRPPPEIALGG